MSCVIKNISISGAMVQLPGHTYITDSFTLVDMQRAVAYRTTLSWRQETRAGMTFLEGHSLTGEVPANLRHVQRLWSSVRQVRGFNR